MTELAMPGEGFMHDKFIAAFEKQAFSVGGGLLGGIAGMGLASSTARSTARARGASQKEIQDAGIRASGLGMIAGALGGGFGASLARNRGAIGGLFPKTTNKLRLSMHKAFRRRDEILAQSKHMYENPPVDKEVLMKKLKHNQNVVNKIDQHVEKIRQKANKLDVIEQRIQKIGPYAATGTGIVAIPSITGLYSGFQANPKRGETET